MNPFLLDGAGWESEGESSHVTRVYSDDGIHADSLVKFESPHATPGSLQGALLFGLRHIGDRVDLRQVQIHPPRWIDRGWSRRAVITVADVGDGGPTAEFSVEIPWITGDEAAGADHAPTSLGAHVGTYWGRPRLPVSVYRYTPGVHYVAPPPGSTTTVRALLVTEWGAAWWLGLGRSRVSAHSTIVRPFLDDLARLSDSVGPEELGAILDRHRVEIHDSRDAPGLSSPLSALEIELGEAGPACMRLRVAVLDRRDPITTHDLPSLLKDAFVERITSGRVDTVTLRGRDVQLAVGDRAFDRARIVEKDIEETARLAKLLRSRGGDWDDADLHRIVLDLVALSAPTGGPSGSEPMSPSLTGRRAAPLLEPGHWSVAGYGTQLALAVARAASEAAGVIDLLWDRTPHASRAPQDHRIDQVAARLRAAVQRAVLDVATGRGAHTNATIVERPVNTLGYVEASRQRSFLGPHGLEPYEGRLDLRVQPAGWRTTLCPVQTPESAKIGFIRHTALAQWGTDSETEPFREIWGDLSLAASLVPFIDHDDPTRIALGAKMLKQAVALVDPQAPLVRTGAERIIGEAGVRRAESNGTLRAIGGARGRVLVGTRPHSFGPAASASARQDDSWRLVPAQEEPVSRGDIVAAAPDVVLEGPDEDEPQFAFGLNALVAFMPWKGWNYEDGIVVSRSFADRMRSRHTVRLSAEYDFDRGDYPIELISPADIATEHSAGTPVIRIYPFDPANPPRELSFPEDFRIVADPNAGDGDSYLVREKNDDGTWTASVRFDVTRDLCVGDKLTTRHGGKGVVTLIVEDADMPRLPDGGTVEVILNPLGVLRRLNVGTLLELHTGLLARLEANARGERPVPVEVGRVLDDRTALADALAGLGASGGRQRLTTARGALVGPDQGVLAGPLYLAKLDHLARDKGGARDDGPASPLTFQPRRSSGWTTDRKLSAPQRLGEMELWSLDAVGARALVDDLFADRGVGERTQRGRSGGDRLLPAGLRAALAHLASAGVRVEAVGVDGAVRDLTTDPRTGRASERLRVVRDDGSALRDVLAEFEDGARTTTSAHEKISELVIERALVDPARKREDPSLVAQSIRFAIPLPAAVAHPWGAKGVMGPLRLPHLQSLPLPAAALLGTDQASEWGGLRRKYARILELVLDHRAAEKRVAADAGEGRDAAKDPELVDLERRIRRAVHGVLGRTRDLPVDDTVAGRLSGKYGLLRRNTLGGSAVRSGRAVLASAPDLDDPETVRIPHWMADTLGIPPAGTGGTEDVVIVNRQPTLHPYSLLALRAVRGDADTVALHPILLAMIAGDFDGDTVAVHRPNDESAREEAWRLLRPAASLRSGASGALLAKLDLDVPLGHVVAGNAANAEGVRAKAIRIVSGHEGKGTDQAAQAWGELAAFARAGYEAAATWSPSVIDAGARDSLASGVAAEAVKATDLPLLFDRRGQVISPLDAEPIETIAESYLDGLPPTAYFAAAQEGVAGIAAKKLVTPYAGSLTRRWVRRSYELVVESLDCGAGAGHGPLLCIGDGVCARACRLTGESVSRFDVGARVGLLAALFIGEQGTQRALKSIHVRGGNKLQETLQRLAALLGDRGAFPLGGQGGDAGRTTTFVEVLNDSWRAKGSLEDAREALRSAFTALLEQRVDPVHLELMLRPIWSDLRNALAASGELTRDDVDEILARTHTAMSAAAWTGSLSPIIRALATQRAEAIDSAELEPVLFASLRNSEAVV